MLSVEREFHDREPPGTDERPGWDRFGFLSSQINCQFQGGEINPVVNYKDIEKWVRDHLCYQNVLASPGRQFVPGILFPPNAWRRAYDPSTDKLIGAIQGSQGPPLLHRVPTSHYIRLDGVVDLLAEREAATGFVTKLVGFVQDTPTQFHDWWFDGPMSIGGESLNVAPQVLEHFLSCSYAVWLSWASDIQQLMISILNMHSRAPGYQWYWERFAWEYTVTDACFNIADKIWPGRFRADGRAKGRMPNHGKRITLLCREFGLKLEDEEGIWIKFAVSLRNGLIHEARWADALPSTESSDEAFIAPGILHKLNQRLITALLDYRNGIIASAWHTLSPALFDRAKSLQ